MDERDRVAVVGSGAVGTFFAASWAAADHGVLVCARRPFTTLVVESATRPLQVATHVVTDATAIDGPYPWVVLAVKAHQTAGARDWLARLCDERTTVVVLQNGVEAVERVAPFSRGAAIVPAVVYCAAELLEPGRIRHDAYRSLIVPDSPGGQRFAEGFGDSHTIVRPEPDFLTHAWRKLGSNVAMNGLTALTGRTTEIASDEAVASVAGALVAECWSVAAAEGAALDPADGPALVAQFATRPPVGTSMLYDRRAGRPTEHDALYGAVLRGARKHGIPTPVTDVVAALLAAA